MVVRKNTMCTNGPPQVSLKCGKKPLLTMNELLLVRIERHSAPHKCWDWGIRARVYALNSLCEALGRSAL